MAARAIGSGTIAFGMVSIPVKLYTATSESESIRFNNLHAECGSRVKQKLHCPACDAMVERDEMVKGYEYSKGKFATFTAEELKVIEMEATGAIDITEFVPMADVDPIYFSKAYFLGPEKGAARPYQLLAEAMRRTQLCAVASYSARGKENLILLRPVEDGVIMQQLRYAYEVRKFSDVPMQDAEVKEGELDLAIRLIEQIAEKQFRPDKHKDELRDRILDLINKKVEGEEITQAAVEKPKAQVIDLMAALKASIEADADGGDPGEGEVAEGEEATSKAKATKPKAAKKKAAK